MTLSTNTTLYLAAPDREKFTTDLLGLFVADAKKRNPDVTSEKMLAQLARPKYNEAIKAINAELESLKIVNRRTNG